MCKFYLSIILFLLIIQSNHAQDIEINHKGKKKFIGLEAGIQLIFTQTPEFEFIRGDVLPYASGGASDFIKGQMNKYHFGIKTELHDKSDHWGFLFGLRYSCLNLSLGRNTLYNNSSKYFYILDHQTGTTTEYFRVNEINRKLGLIGIPVEMRWLSNSAKLLKPCFKLGAELDFKISQSSGVVFYNPDMAEYKDRILEKFNEPSAFNASIYFAGGFSLNTTPGIDFELVFPSISLTPQMSGILKPTIGLGVKLEVRIPY
jgi:hypothetical protein